MTEGSGEDSPGGVAFRRRMVGQVPELAEAPGVVFAPSRIDTWLRCVDHQRDWRHRLDKMADNIDR